MAFDNGSNDNGNNGSNNGGRGNRNSDDKDWKADGFLNFYMPRKNADGTDGRGKLGAIPIKGGDKSDFKGLIEWLKADPKNAAKLASVVTIEFQTAEPAARGAFVLPE